MKRIKIFFSWYSGFAARRLRKITTKNKMKKKKLYTFSNFISTIIKKNCKKTKIPSNIYEIFILIDPYTIINGLLEFDSSLKNKSLLLIIFISPEWSMQVKWLVWYNQENFWNQFIFNSPTGYSNHHAHWNPRSVSTRVENFLLNRRKIWFGH